jgi:hypothetical protein
MQASHRAATEKLGRPSRSDVRILYFADKPGRDWHGYAKKYAEFKLPVIGPAVSEKKGGDVVEEAKRMIAAAYHVKPEAVRISVDLVLHSRAHHRKLVVGFFL